MSLSLAAAGICASRLSAMAIDVTDPIDTNRPSFMYSPLVVPRGSIQVENGTQFSGFRKGQWTYDLPETNLRVGLAKRTEIQMFAPELFLFRDANNTFARASDLSEIGIKQHFPIGKKINLAALLAVTAPTGARAVYGPGTIPVVRLPYSYAINDRWSVCGMQSFLLLDNGRSPQWQPDVLVCRNFGTKANVFMEYGGAFTRNHNALNLIHFGSTYDFSHCQQLDIHFGFGLNQSAPTAFVGAGYSVRFDQLHF